MVECSFLIKNLDLRLPFFVRLVFSGLRGGGRLSLPRNPDFRSILYQSQLFPLLLSAANPTASTDRFPRMPRARRSPRCVFCRLSFFLSAKIIPKQKAHVLSFEKQRVCRIDKTPLRSREASVPIRI